MPEPTAIPFADWLESLRTELAQAQQAGQGNDLRLQVDKIELEIEVLSTREAGGRAGVRFWVVDAGANGKAASGLTQRLRLFLTPVAADGTRIVVQDELDEEPA